jgi:hypothetical protein
MIFHDNISRTLKGSDRGDSHDAGGLSMMVNQVVDHEMNVDSILNVWHDFVSSEKASVSSSMRKGVRKAKVKKATVKVTTAKSSTPILSQLNPRVEARTSNIPDAGLGLFALEDIEKDSVICTYGGRLVDYEEAKYQDPEYSVDFELGKGMKLIGDAVGDDLGIYANAIHPNNKEVKQNARFHIKSKVYLENKRGRYDILARRDIAKGEEIIVSYGKFYWTAVAKFKTNPPVKPMAAVRRDERAMKRNLATTVPKQTPSAEYW